MAESNPSYRYPRVLPEGDKPKSAFTTNYDALIEKTAENSVNMAHSNGMGILISAQGTVSVGNNGMVIRGYQPTVTGLQEFQPIGPLSNTTEQPELPIDAERILAWIKTPDRLEFVLDTFEINYRKRVLRDGETAAKTWLWWQVSRTLAESIFQISPRIAAIVYLLRRIWPF
jgi:hypothetical protein